MKSYFLKLKLLKNNIFLKTQKKKKFHFTLINFVEWQNSVLERKRKVINFVCELRSETNVKIVST